MKIRTLKFGTPNVTRRGDETIIRFPFTMVGSNLEGTPEERQKTSRHDLEVAITRSRRTSWKLDNAALCKVLFEIGTRKLKEKLHQGDLSESEKVQVTTRTHPGNCPFDPDCVQNLKGAVIRFEIDQKIGFTR